MATHGTAPKVPCGSENIFADTMMRNGGRNTDAHVLWATQHVNKPGMVARKLLQAIVIQMNGPL